MAAIVVSFRWLDLLEKEFDKSFVDLDLIIGEVEDVDDGDWSHQVRTKLGALSSCFAQLAHKAQTIFQSNAKLEAEIVNFRHELAHNEALYNITKDENHEMLVKLHSYQLQLHKHCSNSQESAVDSSDIEIIKEKLEKQLEEERSSRLSLEVPRQEIILLRRENEMLRKNILALYGELSGAKLTSKYLDKELAGRIQQLQLLSRELKGEQHERLWKQLEAEIHLHRHKTVVRACRTNNLQPHDETQTYVIEAPLPKPPMNQLQRIVTLHKGPNQGLGMSITGGREHGVPILISVLHNDLPARSCGQLYVGDAIISVNGISLKEVTHAEAVEIMSCQEGDIQLEVVFVSPEEEGEDESITDDSYRYKVFDEEVDSMTSSLHFAQNGRLSRASIDSIRGSTDNILGSPRSMVDIASEIDDLQINGFQSHTYNHDHARNIDLACATEDPENLEREMKEHEDVYNNGTAIDESSEAFGRVLGASVVSQESTESSLSLNSFSEPLLTIEKSSTNSIAKEGQKEHILQEKEPPMDKKKSFSFSHNVFNSNY